MYTNILSAKQTELANQLTKNISELNEIQDVKTILDKWYYNRLLTTTTKRKTWELQPLKEYLIERLKKSGAKDLAKFENRLKTVFDASKKISSITISVEWAKNKTWGNCPKSEVRICFDNNSCEHFESGRITGCGYDKESTAIAQALNQCNELLHIMYSAKNERVNDRNDAIFGYGSGYGLYPSFEGGVGTSCYPRIFESLGFNMSHISGGKTFDSWQVLPK